MRRYRSSTTGSSPQSPKAKPAMGVCKFAAALVLSVMAALLLTAESRASFDKLYVDGVQKRIFLLVDFDEVYVVAKDAEDIFGRNDISFDQTTLAVTIGDRVVPAKISYYETTPCYPLSAICKELNLPFSWDHFKGRIDMSLKPKPKMDENGDQSGQSETRRQRIRKKRGLFINLVSEDYLKDPSDRVRAVRVQTLVRNTYFREVKKARAKCSFFYPDGTVLREDETILENIGHDESRRVIFYSENPSSTEVLQYKFEITEIRDK